MKFLLTVDTEADNQWDVDAPLTTANLACIPRFQTLCDEFGFCPTYLCTYEVVTSDAFDRILLPYLRERHAELGAHLHPWSTPPFDDEWDAGGLGHAYPSELPAELLAGKLESLTFTLAERTGAAPTSYRAGRWGMSASQISILLELGYRVDCSVTPLISWARDIGLREGGPDFTGAPNVPYRVSSEDVNQPGTSGLLEVPVTILYTSALMRRSPLTRALYHRHRRSIPGRAADRLFHLAPQWLRPYPEMSARRLVAVCETARRLDLPVIEMMLHSSELMPGGSPYSQTVEAIDDLFERLRTTFRYLVEHHVEGMTLSAYAVSRTDEACAERVPIPSR